LIDQEKNGGAADTKGGGNQTHRHPLNAFNPVFQVLDVKLVARGKGDKGKGDFIDEPKAGHGVGRQQVQPVGPHQDAGDQKSGDQGQGGAHQVMADLF